MLGCLQNRLSKVVPKENFKIAWKDASFHIHSVFYGNKVLGDSEQEVVKANVREILIHNRKNSLNYWCACLAYELNRANSDSFTLYINYVILSLASFGDFQQNTLDLLPERQLFLEKSYLEGLEIASDSASFSDKP